MKKLVFSGAATLLFSASIASAGGLAAGGPPPGFMPNAERIEYGRTCPVVEPVVNALREQGYSGIQVDAGRRLARFDARRGNQRVEYVYDCRGGEALRQESRTVTLGEPSPGFRVNMDDDGDANFLSDDPFAANDQRDAAEQQGGTTQQSGTSQQAGADQQDAASQQSAADDGETGGQPSGGDQQEVTHQQPAPGGDGGSSHKEGADQQADSQNPDAGSPSQGNAGGSCGGGGDGDCGHGNNEPRDFDPDNPGTSDDAEGG